MLKCGKCGQQVTSLSLDTSPLAQGGYVRGVPVYSVPLSL